MSLRWLILVINLIVSVFNQDTNCWVGVWGICWRDWPWEDAFLEGQQSVLAKVQSDWRKCCYCLPACLSTGESFDSMVATAATMLFWRRNPDFSSFHRGLKTCSSPRILQIFVAGLRLLRHPVAWNEHGFSISPPSKWSLWTIQIMQCKPSKYITSVCSCKNRYLFYWSVTIGIKRFVLNMQSTIYFKVPNHARRNVIVKSTDYE